MSKTVNDDWYRYPQYYDIAFQADTALEADFVEAACRKYGLRPAARLLEPGCGSGRLIAELASRGCSMIGFDSCAPALSYARRRIRRRKLSAELFQANLERFCTPEPADAAFCLCNTFRHLQTEKAARTHLASVASALQPGGLYILGLHLLPPDADPYDCERWTECRRGVTVTVTLRVLEAMPHRRLELIRTSLLARTPQKVIRVRSDYLMRTYSARQLKRLLDSTPQFELCDVFDFCCDISEPLQLDDTIADTVLVLRKRGT